MTTQVDPPVRSVRVAVALAERFRDLISGPSSGDVNTMSLRIGEAQQLYPEIWGHLDEARGVFASRGADMSGYDQIRMHEQGLLGVTDMDLVTVGYGRSEHQVRTANFNIAGYERARHAAAALMRAVPTVDWESIARQEALEDAAIGSVRSKSWIPIVVIAVILLVILYVKMSHK